VISSKLSNVFSLLSHSPRVHAEKNDDIVLQLQHSSAEKKDSLFSAPIDRSYKPYPLLNSAVFEEANIKHKD